MLSKMEPSKETGFCFIVIAPKLVKIGLASGGRTRIQNPINCAKSKLDGGLPLPLRKEQECLSLLINL